VPETSQLLDAYPQGELVNDLWRQGWPTHRLMRNELEVELAAVERFIERAVSGSPVVVMDSRLTDELQRMRLTVATWRDVDSKGEPPRGTRQRLRELGVDVPNSKVDAQIRKGKKV
jgi:hypothetical protein